MSRDQEILLLIDAAVDACHRTISEARDRGESWMIEDATAATTQFEKIADQVRSQNLAPSHGGGLGITRALGEWAPDYLYSAGAAVEDFYIHNW